MQTRIAELLCVMQIHRTKGIEMIYQHDWIMRQIEAIVFFLVGIITGRGADKNDVMRMMDAAAGTNKLYARLNALVQERKICEAENLLCRAVSEDDPEALEAGMLFYFDINRLGDDVLEECNFSRDEILDGISALGRTYGFPMDYIEK